MPNENTHREYAAKQIMRLSFFPDFPRHSEGLNELVNFAAKRSMGQPANLAGVIDEAVDLARCPTIADLKALWNAKFPNLGSRVEGCGRCRNNIGWVITVDAAGNSAAARCPCGALPGADEHRVMNEADRPAKQTLRTVAEISEVSR